MECCTQRPAHIPLRTWLVSPPETLNCSLQKHPVPSLWMEIQCGPYHARDAGSISCQIKALGKHLNQESCLWLPLQCGVFCICLFLKRQSTKLQKVSLLSALKNNMKKNMSKDPQSYPKLFSEWLVEWIKLTFVFKQLQTYRRWRCR